MRKITIIITLFIVLSSTLFTSCSDFLAPEIVREILRWSVFWSSDSINIRSIDSLSDTDYWFAGRDYDTGIITIGHYSNGTWAFTPIDDGGYGYINGIDMLSDTEGWLVGNYGLVYRMQNGEWADVTDFPGYDNCMKVQALSSDSVWVLDGYYAYYYDGSTWTSYNFDNYVSDIYMYDGVGYAFSNYDNSFYSWNGLTWTQEETTLPGANTGFISMNGSGYFAVDTNDENGYYTAIYERTPGTPVTYTQVYRTGSGVYFDTSTGDNAGNYFFAGNNASITIENGQVTDLKAAPPEETYLYELKLLSPGKIIGVGSGYGAGEILKN